MLCAVAGEGVSAMCSKRNRGAGMCSRGLGVVRSWLEGSAYAYKHVVAIFCILQWWAGWARI